MANTFITPSVIASRGLATLYNTIVLAGLVSRDYDQDFTGSVGDTITIRKPAIFTAEVFNRAAGITLQDVVEHSTTVKLDTIANVSFPVTDEQMTLSIEDFATQLLDPAMEAIAQKVDGDLAELLTDAANDVGGGGVADMGTGTGVVANTAFRIARTKLSRNKLPALNRVAVLSPEAVSVALGDPLLIQAQQAGSTDALREAIIGRILGMDTYETQVYGVGAADRGQTDAVAFHRSAVVLAVRPLQPPRGLASTQVSTQSYKGLALRTVYSYNNTLKQDEVSVDMLYGLAATRPEGAVEMDFHQGS
jgi:P22 coat protein - gene protein 5